MEPIRFRTPHPARERLTGSQPDAVQQSADQRVFPLASGHLDGLPVRRNTSRTHLPPSPASLPAFSAGGLGDLVHHVDQSRSEALPCLSAQHAETAAKAVNELQSALRAAAGPAPSEGIAAPLPQLASNSSDASPEAHGELSALGYSQSQQKQIEPQARFIVARYHQALVSHGFTHAHIVELSKRPAALGTMAATYPDIIAALPEATHEDIVGVGKQRAGARALAAMLKVAAELREPPLQLVEDQLLKIAKRGGASAVQAVYALRNVLTAAPLHLSAAQMVAIASNDGGRQALETVKRLLPVLCKDYRLTSDQVVAIARNKGGKQALETVHRLLPVLCKEHGLTQDQVVGIASHDGGKQALETVQRLLPALCKDHGLTPDQVVAIAGNHGGKQALETILRLLPALCKDHGLTQHQVVAIASHGGGKHALETLHDLLPALCKDHGLTPDQAVTIANHDGGRQALETVQRLLPVLCEEHGLTPAQVVAIASNIGGKQALETVQRLLPLLCRQYGLTPAQVVTIARNNGGKQALETVQRLLPVLCNHHGLSPDQVVAIASNIGGKQALETVQRLLPVLCNHHGLSPDQVVAIASNNGGKQALETVQRLLPVLCKDHGLTRNQVVAIASNGAGRQALESVFAQLSCPHPALAALSNTCLVALACLGGRSALDAVIKGLPHAPKLIQKANRLAACTSHRSADAVRVSQVLSFFQHHPHPVHAFDEAMTRFGISRPGLLQLFRRVGVTELEALSGTLPPASQRWQRILQALGEQSSSSASASASASASSQNSEHAFADFLERELDTLSPLHEAAHVLAGSNRKRPLSADSVDHSAQQTAKAPVPEQPDAPDAYLPSEWGLKRPRTEVGGGNPGPDAPTGADLEVPNTPSPGYDAASLSWDEEDFPLFSDEELKWLSTLLDD